LDAPARPIQVVAGTLLGTFLAIHFVVIAVAAAGLLTAMLATLLTAGLLTAMLAALLTAAFAMTLTLLAGLIPLPSLVLSRPLFALGLVSGLLRGFRFLSVARHVDSPRMLKPRLR
jgi:hypothetical protein